jgi:probable HAF family extracellular repeat protein
MLRQSTFVLCGIALVFTLAGLASATNYTLTDLGTLTGSTNPTSYALAVNDSGVVVGTSSTSKTSTKFMTATIYTPGSGGWVNIGAGFRSQLGITSAGTFANAINDAGQVSGYLYEATPVVDTDSFIYNTSTQAYTDIAAQPGVCNGGQVQCGENMWNPTVVEYQYPGSINSSGQTVGEYTNTAGASGTFVWNGSSTTNVPSPASCVSGINNAGVVVGNEGGGESPIPIGFYYSGGTTLTTITDMAYPQAIIGNEVVGADWPNTNGPTYAAIYTLGASSATYIGTAGQDSFAYGASSNGTVVGYNGNDAFVYSNGTITDLNSLIQGGLGAFSDLNVAYGISPNGEYIVGTGTIASNGFTQGFLLTAVPTPEPSALLLAVSGIFGLLAYAWRKRK